MYLMIHLNFTEKEKDSSDAAEKEKPAYNYSMEKYLDPNRPFKCEVCKESFTQKNILLVHYNSVGHLHRQRKEEQGKKEKQEQQQQRGGDEASPERSSSSSPPQNSEKTPTKGSALEALLGNIRGERKDDDEVKPFKCNICKVAYSQGSTLDIHVRSVLHQTKASKLQELILTGQIDLNKPLIEQPDPQQLQDQHKKMLSDMLSPKSINSTGSTNSQSSPPNQRSASSPQSSPLAGLHALMSAKNADASGSSSSADEALSSTNNAMMSNLAKTFPFLANLSPTTNNDNNKGQSSDKQEPPSPVLKNLLQNYGLEMVKQFSEQRQSDKKEEEDEDKQQKKPETDKLSDVQEALQKAMIQAQLQQMNPMLMQMSQLQNLNPLLAMNLHPPLVPPALLKNANQSDFPSAILAHMQQQQQQSTAGALGGMMDPKLLALMAANRNEASVTASGGNGTEMKPQSQLPFPPPPGARYFSIE